MDLPSPSGDVLEQPTRARLFAALVNLKGGASTEELADRLDRHPNGVRRHLEQMREAGLLERQRVQGRKGRPRDRWLVAAGANPGGTRPSAYADLAGWLVRAIPAGPGRLRQIERSGREIGREVTHADRHDPLESFRLTLTALGFQPELAVRRDGELVCRLGNCPYRDAVRENADVVCTLHRGITVGLLAELDPEAKLTRFEPHDPERAGCLVEVAGGSWHAPSQSKRSSASA